MVVTDGGGGVCGLLWLLQTEEVECVICCGCYRRRRWSVWSVVVVTDGGGGVCDLLWLLQTEEVECVICCGCYRWRRWSV